MLKYCAPYNLKDCLSLLGGKNMYDVFEYRFEYTNETLDNANIIFTKCNTHMCRSIRTSYLVKFIAKNDCTIIEMHFQDELFILPLPCIPEKWVDEFMEQKLDAMRI